MIDVFFCQTDRASSGVFQGRRILIGRLRPNYLAGRSEALASDHHIVPLLDLWIGHQIGIAALDLEDRASGVGVIRNRQPSQADGSASPARRGTT